MSGCQGGVPRPPTSAPLGDSDQHKSGEGAGTWTGVAVGPRTGRCLAHSPWEKGTAGTVSGDWGPLCRPSLSLPIPGKVPSPSQLSVTELPGDEVQLEWAAAAVSGVLASTRSRGHPWERGKPVRWGCGPSHPAPPCEPGPREGHLPQVDTSPFSPQISVPRGTWARPSCLAWGGTQNMRSPSWPTIATGPLGDPVSLRYTPVGDPALPRTPSLWA